MACRHVRPELVLLPQVLKFCSYFLCGQQSWTSPPGLAAHQEINKLPLVNLGAEGVPPGYLLVQRAGGVWLAGYEMCLRRLSLQCKRLTLVRPDLTPLANEPAISVPTYDDNQKLTYVADVGNKGKGDGRVPLDAGQVGQVALGKGSSDLGQTQDAGAGKIDADTNAE